MKVDTRTGIALVALGSALWGTDALFRRGLALELTSVEVVFWEHLLLVLFTLPLIVRGLRFCAAPWRDWAAIAVVGGGSSVAATVLLTEAFQHGDPTTPLLREAAAGDRRRARVLLLGERLRPRYFVFLAAALVSSYLMAFADPTEVTVDQRPPALLGVGAATLWALGTVLGKRLARTFRRPSYRAALRVRPARGGAPRDPVRRRRPAAGRGPAATPGRCSASPSSRA